MDLSILLAKTFGVYFIVISLVGLLNRGQEQPILKEFIGNAALMSLGGMMALIIGTLMVFTHNIWVWDWRGIVTILGWAALLKGIFILLFPRLAIQFYTKWVTSNGVYKFSFALVFVMGIYLFYQGWSYS